MISIQRPGQDPLQIDFILIDFEGTLASGRRVHPKAKDKINLLSKRTKIYILTKEEKEAAEETLRKVKAELLYLAEGDASQRKLDLLRQLGSARTVVMGNGVDDAPMIEEAGLGICVIGKEGASAEAIKKADVVVLNILDALDFLLKPLRQKNTLGQ
ncbi:MAG: ATPase P [Thermodesulfobacteriota bacterium]